MSLSSPNEASVRETPGSSTKPPHFDLVSQYIAFRFPQWSSEQIEASTSRLFDKHKFLHGDFESHLHSCLEQVLSALHGREKNTSLELLDLTLPAQVEHVILKAKRTSSSEPDQPGSLPVTNYERAKADFERELHQYVEILVSVAFQAESVDRPFLGKGDAYVLGFTLLPVVLFALDAKEEVAFCMGETSGSAKVSPQLAILDGALRKWTLDTFCPEKVALASGVACLAAAAGEASAVQEKADAGGEKSDHPLWQLCRALEVRDVSRRDPTEN